MPVEVREQVDSRDDFWGRRGGVRQLRRYVISGTADETEARAALFAEAPDAVDPFGSGFLLIPRSDVRGPSPRGQVDGDGAPTVFEAEVEYVSLEADQGADEVPAGFTFETASRTKRVVASREHRGVWTPTGLATAPTWAGLIGWNPDTGKAEGVDVEYGIASFTIPYRTAALTLAQALYLCRLYGRINDASYLGFATGELRFMGARGARRGAGPWDFTYSFLAQMDEDDVVVGDITIPTVRGWDVLSVITETQFDESSQALGATATHVAVDRVLPYGDFSGLGLE